MPTPEPHSFTAAMRDAAVEVLQAEGHAVRVSDLYAKGFDPVAKAADFPSRQNPDYLVYALEQRHAWDSGTLPDDIRNELDLVLWADLLILSFPMYWFSVPAMLKGWIDRVLLSGPTYGGKRFYDRGGLVGKKGLLAFTLGARPHMFGERAIHGPLDDMLRPLLRGTLYYVGMEVLPPLPPIMFPTSTMQHAAASSTPTALICDSLRRYSRSVFPALRTSTTGSTPATKPPAPVAGDDQVHGENLHRLAVLVARFAAHRGGTALGSRSRRRDRQNFRIHRQHVPGPGRPRPGEFAAGADHTAGNGQAAVNDQAHGQRRCVPAAGGQSAEERATGGGIVEVKRLRIVCRREGLDPGRIDRD